MSKISDKQIDNYALNYMSPEEKESFEKEMETNEELRKEVQFFQQIVQTAQFQKLFETKSRIKEATVDWRNYVSEFEQSTSTGAISKGFENLADSINNLIAQFFMPYSAAYRNVAVEQLSTEDQGFFYYNKKEYSKAIPMLQKLPEDDHEAQLMIGSAYAALQDYESAYPYFKQLIDDEAVFYLDEAYWYAALSLIGLNRLEEAKKHVQDLINKKKISAAMRENAYALLQKINQ